jgi:hypothetical protein
MATHILSRADDPADVVPHRVTRSVRVPYEFDALLEAASARCRTHRFCMIAERAATEGETRLHFLFLCAEEAVAFAADTLNPASDDRE